MFEKFHWLEITIIRHLHVSDYATLDRSAYLDVCLSRLGDVKVLGGNLHVNHDHSKRGGDLPLPALHHKVIV
jgi:hypothetical protein